MHGFTHRLLRSTALSGLLLLACVSGASADEIMVQFEPGATPADQRAAVDAVGGTVVRRLDAINAAVVAVATPGGASRSARSHGTSSAAHVLAESESVAYAEPDQRVHISWEPGDPGIVEQWHLAALGVPAAWDITKGGGVIVAVVDTGVDADHEDLMGKVIAGPDYVDGDADPSDEQGHGTHVSGIVAASAANAVGGAGIAPEAQILAIRALDATGSGYVSDIVTGVIAAADRGARVINLSLGGGPANPMMADAIKYASRKGALVVCASGNESASAVSFPAVYNGCLAVGATSQQGARASFSNRGPNLDITAPGVGIYSTTPYSMYEAWDGTSMAAPVVSGVAALLYSQGRSRANVIGTLQQTATDAGKPGWDGEYGAGIVNAAAAVAASKDLLERPATDLSIGRCGATAGNRCKLKRRQKLTISGHYTATTSTSPIVLTFSQQTKAGRFAAKFTKRVTPNDTGGFTLKLPLATRTGTWRVQSTAKPGWSAQAAPDDQAFFQVR